MIMTMIMALAKAMVMAIYVCPLSTVYVHLCLSVCLPVCLSSYEHFNFRRIHGHKLAVIFYTSVARGHVICDVTQTGPKNKDRPSPNTFSDQQNDFQTAGQFPLWIWEQNEDPPYPCTSRWNRATGSDSRASVNGGSWLHL